jgi:hypothetical protein
MAKQLITGMKIVDGRVATSTGSHNPWYVGDFMQLTVSLSSSATFPTSFPIQGSNADGFQAVIPENSWSQLTNIVGIGTGLLATIDPGFRWVRSSVSTQGMSATSAFTMVFMGRT